MEAPQVLARLFLHVPAAGIDGVAVVGAPDIGRKVPSAVGGYDLQIGEPVEKPVEDHVGEGESRLERIPHRVREPAVPAEPPGGFREAAGVDEDESVERRGRGRSREERAIRGIVVDASRFGLARKNRKKQLHYA